MVSACAASTARTSSPRDQRPTFSTTATAAASSPAATGSRPAAVATPSIVAVGSRPTGNCMLSDVSTISATTGFSSTRSSSRSDGPASTKTSRASTAIRQALKAYRCRGESQGIRSRWRRAIHQPAGTKSRSPMMSRSGRAQCHSTRSILAASSWPTPQERASQTSSELSVDCAWFNCGGVIAECPCPTGGSRCRSRPDRPRGRAAACPRAAGRAHAAAAYRWRPVGWRRGRGADRPPPPSR